ncbi:hypothetical protein [Streptomyces sp. CAU 1734]|uniref:hypothetical protein n=1 Tax=Streptomyces sp. CAU 1734 TaxID=3140360 RepID=UPI0032603583
MQADQRQQRIRTLIQTASAEQLRTALKAVLSVTATVQRERDHSDFPDFPDYSDYDLPGSRSQEDGEFKARSYVGQDVDVLVLAALEAGTDCGS